MILDSRRDEREVKKRRRREREKKKKWSRNYEHKVVARLGLALLLTVLSRWMRVPVSNSGPMGCISGIDTVSAPDRFCPCRREKYASLWGIVRFGNSGIYLCLVYQVGQASHFSLWSILQNRYQEDQHSWQILYHSVPASRPCSVNVPSPCNC